MVAIAVLGPLTISGDETLAPRDRVVLAALTTRRGEVVSPDALAEALWGERAPVTWNKQVQASIVRLRRALGTGAIDTVDDGYRLAVAGDEIDVQRFERLLGRARELEALGAWERSAHLVGEALALWRGAPLREVECWPPGQIEAARLEALRLDAEESQLEAGLRAGQHRQLVPRARACVSEQPLREHRWELLARALYMSGQQGEALRSIREARQRLAEELGVDPGPDLVALEGAILRHDPSLAVSAAASEASASCPYRGLVPYNTTDADIFFGRNAAVSACLQRLAEHGALVVVGPSGSGKSSLVRAGVAGALERDGCRVIVITPGLDPLSALRSASPTREAVLVVDQCEEAFALCSDVGARADFFSRLSGHQGPLVIALRADRLGDVAAHAPLLRIVERGLYLVQPMNDTEIRAAIEEPARRAGLLMEPGLTDLLVREVDGEPGALPLLSHALAQTWSNREGRTLTVAGYIASGGIRGAIAQTAEQIYEHADERQRPLVRDLMLRLVTPGDGGEPVRTRVQRRAVATDDDHDTVIELLVSARLVTSDDGVVELAHEALTRAWPRLLDWLDDDADGQRIRRHLTNASDSWDAMSRPAAELYRGSRLDRAIEWRERAAPNLNRTETDFLECSSRHAEAERGAARRRRRRVTLALVTGLALTTTLAMVAFTSRSRADRQADRASVAAERADEAAARARSHELASASISMLAEDPSLAMLLSVASVTTSTQTAESTAALHQAFAADRVVARHLLDLNDEAFALQSTDIDPTGRWMAVAGAYPVTGSGRTLEVVDLTDDTIVWRHDATEAAAGIASPVFSADGQQVVTGVYWDPYNPSRSPVLGRDVIEDPVPDIVGARVWDTATGQPRELYDLGRCGGTVAGISSSHLLVRTLHGTPDVVAACDWAQGTMGTELVDRHTGERRVLTADSGTPLCGAAMSDDGRLVAYDDFPAGTHDRGVHDIVVAEVATGDIAGRVELKQPASSCGVRALSPDGSLLLAGDQPIRVWDVATGDIVASFDGHGGRSRSATFSTNGDVVLSSGADGALREWDALTGEEIAAHPGVGDGRVSVSDTGLVLVSDAYLQSSLIDTRTRGEGGAASTCRGSATPDGLRIAGRVAVFQVACTRDQFATTYVVDVSTARVLATLSGQGAVGVAADGTRFVQQAARSDGPAPLVIHDSSNGEPLMQLEGTIDAAPSRITWSPDGAVIAAAVGTSVHVWNASTGSLLFADDPDPARVAITDVIFSPDSHTLLVTANDSRVRLISTSNWTVEQEISGGYSVGLVGYSADGTQLLAATQFMANSSSALHWFDLRNQQVDRSTPPLPIGSLRSVAISPDSQRIATASSDGRIRIWNAATLELDHEIPLSDANPQGVAFIDDQHLAITPAAGGLSRVTLDTDELLMLVRQSLTRGFTKAECERFGFDDTCPTLADLAR